LILDTCAAGMVIERLWERREVSSSRARALERMKDRTGLFILAGSAADAASYAASRFGQGLLTYSLLLGMRGAALETREEGIVDTERLFDFAVHTVPELAKGVGGIQAPRIAIPRGGASFPLGLLDESDRARIPIAQRPLPFVIRSAFQNEARIVDDLGVGRAMNEVLAEASSFGRESPFVFVDTEELPGAYRVVGRYRVSANHRVAVDCRISQDGKEVDAFSVEGDSADPRRVAAGIAARIHLPMRTN
jgi:hypothetical protein